MNTKFDPLTDPSLRGHYRRGRTAEELCREAHHFHMQRVRQDQWLKDVLYKADKRRADDEERMEKELPKLVAQAQGKRTRVRKRVEK